MRELFSTILAYRDIKSDIKTEYTWWRVLWVDNLKKRKRKGWLL